MMRPWGGFREMGVVSWYDGPVVVLGYSVMGRVVAVMALATNWNRWAVAGVVLAAWVVLGRFGLPPVAVGHSAGIPVVESNPALTLPQAVDSERLQAEFLELVTIPSPSGQEGPLRDHLLAVLNGLDLKGMGGHVTVDDKGNILVDIPAHTGSPERIHPGVETLSASGAASVAPSVAPSLAPSAGESKTLLMGTHMDTVTPCEGVTPHIEHTDTGALIRTDGTTILGADDKAAIAIVLSALRYAQAHDWPHPRLKILMSVEEELGLFGAKAVDPRWIDDVDLMVILDHAGPPGLVVLESPRIDLMTLETFGKSAHSGMEPEKGINALTPMVQALAQLPVGRLDSETTANFGVISGGERFNVVPNHITVEGEVRSFVGQRVEKYLRTVEALLAHFTHELPGSRYSVAIHPVVPVLEGHMDDPAFHPLWWAIAQTGVPPQLHRSNGASDLNVLARSDIPGAVLGIGYYEPHQTKEYVMMGEMAQSVQLLLWLWWAMAGQPGAVQA